MKKDIVMAGKKNISDNDLKQIVKNTNLENYVSDLINSESEKEIESFIFKFIDFMRAAKSLDKCNAGGIKLIMDLNNSKCLEEDQIKILHALIKADLAKKDTTKNPLIVGMSKQDSIARLNEIVNTSKDEKLVMEAIKQLTTLNNWLDSSDAEEIIKSNNALIDTILKTFNQSEMEYLAFSFVEPEVSAVQSVENDDDDNESVISEIEVV